MHCPVCKRERLRVTDSVKTPENEIYRQRECKDCGHIFYTVEFDIEPTKKFRSEWLKYYRSKGKIK